MRLLRSKRNGIVGAVFPSRWLDGVGFVRGHNQTSRAFNIRLAASRYLGRSTFVSAASHLLAFLSVAVVVEVQAADQSVNLQYSPSAASIESPAEEAFLFWERFKAAFDQGADELFADQLGPFNAMNWSIKFADRDSDYLRERSTSAARHAFSKSSVYSLREASVDLPIMLWLKEREGFLADLLRNSVGNVEEEAVSPLDVSYRNVERSWWEHLSESGGVRYGIRPFRADPYAYLSLGIKDGDRVVLLTHVRYYYGLFADHRFEIALSLPLAHGFAIDLGTLYQVGRYGEEKKLVVKLFKELKAGGIVHVGLETKDRPALFAGITFPL